MKKLLALGLPAALLTAAIAIVLGTPSQAKAVDLSTMSHTQNRSCGNHCHHHGHYWSCDGYTYYCGGHD